MAQLRRTNTALEQAGHYTITKIILRDTEFYGFAVSDDGDDIYLPTNVCKRHNLTDADVGAGFRAMTRAQNGSTGSKATRAAFIPLLFDDTAPVQVNGSAASLHDAVRLSVSKPVLVTDDPYDASYVDAADHAALQADVDAVLEAVDQTLSAFDHFVTLLESKHFNNFKDQLLNLRAVVDTRFPEEGKDQ